jgi:hypothetical protein
VIPHAGKLRSAAAKASVPWVTIAPAKGAAVGNAQDRYQYFKTFQNNILSAKSEDKGFTAC